jgi:predicted nucleic acid-binding protein
VTPAETTEHAHRIVIADANVLINLIHVSRLSICWNLPGYGFVAPEHVHEEITNVGQRAVLDEALTQGHLRTEAITDPAAIQLFADLTARLGRGEAACLALAVHTGWAVASDEKGRFRKEVLSRIGNDRIVGTADLFVLAIRCRLLTIQEADADKVSLESRRFVMPFQSFSELLT